MPFDGAIFGCNVSMICRICSGRRGADGAFVFAARRLRFTNGKRWVEEGTISLALKSTEMEMTGGSGVVLITGAAPYLGGSTTWLPLRRAAPELAFTEIDALDFVDAPGRRLIDAAEAKIALAIRSAIAVVAHAGAARLVLEVVARECPNIPVLLLSPMLILHDTPALKVLRSLLARRPGAWLLMAYARSKHRRLKRDRAYVAKQLKLFVETGSLSEALIEEAQVRIRDARSERAVAATADVFLNVTTPLDAEQNRAVKNRAVLVGTGSIDRKTASRMPVTVLRGVNAAAMLDAPEDVAQALRALIRDAKRSA